MSLQICPYCKKENPYWTIYKEINCKHFSKGMSIDCASCKHPMKIQYKTKNNFQMFCHGIAWMLLPVAVIYLVYIGKLSYIYAIIFMIVFHFLAMYYLIKRMNYEHIS